MKMSILKNVLPEMNDLVRKGLYVDNLSRIEGICKGVIVLGEYPTVFYVLQSICRELRRAWEDRAVTVEEYKYVRDKLTGPIQDILDSVQSNMEKQFMTERLDILILKFIEVRSQLY